MKTLKLEVPERLAEAVEGLVREGWFADESELVRQALTEFVHRHGFQFLCRGGARPLPGGGKPRPYIQEQFQQEDIRWALSLKDAQAK